MSLRIQCGLVFVTLLLVVAPTSRAQEVSFRPVFRLAAAHDSNIYGFAEDPVADSFFTTTVQLPLSYRLSPRSSLALSYLAASEWYDQQKQLNDLLARQTASLSYSNGAERGLTFSLRGAFNDSYRPEDVFPDSGVELGRRRSQTTSAGVSVGHSMGARGDLVFAYDFSHGRYLEDQSTNRHLGSVTLGRQFGRDTHLDVRYAQDYYRLTDESSDSSGIATLGLGQTLGRRTILSLRAGVRILENDTRPEVDASLTFTGRRSSLSLHYGHTQTFLPTVDAAGSLSEVDRVGVTLSFQGRRYRLTLSPTYYYNTFGERRTETARGLADLVVMFNRWLGIGTGYNFTLQRNLAPFETESRRHVVHGGLVLSPWARAGQSPDTAR